MSESGIMTVHLRERVTEDSLRGVLANLLGLSKEDLSPLDMATSKTLVPYQYTPRARGFRTTIEVYVGQISSSVPQSDVALAKLLARYFAQDALVSPPAEAHNPYLWLLVHPDGTVANVVEVVSDNDEEDGIVIVEETQ